MSKVKKETAEDYRMMWRDLLIAIGYAKLKIPVSDLAKIFNLTRTRVYSIIKKK